MSTATGHLKPPSKKCPLVGSHQGASPCPSLPQESYSKETVIIVGCDQWVFQLLGLTYKHAHGGYTSYLYMMKCLTVILR